MAEKFKRIGADNEYARRVRASSPGLMTTFALQNRSIGARDVLARAASQGRYGFHALVDLVKTLQKEPRATRTREFMATLEAKPIVALAKVLANQSLQPLDDYDSIVLYKSVIAHYGTKSMNWDDRLVFLELLAGKRWRADVDKYSRLFKLEAHDPGQFAMLKANAVNPFRAGTEDLTDTRVDSWLSEVNAALAADGLEPISIGPGSESPFDRIMCSAATFIDSGPQVTVIVPTFNPGPRIETAIESLLGQSHRNLQILIMDDASPESSARELDRWPARDPRISVVHLPENAGTYRARNIAVSQYATGDYITVHDDDDWSHPRKIELQVADLQRHSHELANVSLLSRATDHLQFARINNNPVFTQKNYSSMMFRRSVFDTLGYWDVVNRSADAEMFDRIVAVTGRPIRAVGSAPMSFLRIREASLTAGEIHKGYIDARRVWYQRLSRAWHSSVIEGGGVPRVALDYPSRRPFAAPVGMVGSKQRAVVHDFDVLYVTDFRFPGGNSSLAVRELEEMLRVGLRVGLLQMDSPLLGPKNALHAGIVDLLAGEGLSIVSHLDNVKARLTVVRHPTVLQYARLARSGVKTERLVVIINHAPHERDMTGAVYDVSDVVNNAAYIFGIPPKLAPESGLIRELMRGLADPAMLTSFNWEGIVEGISGSPRATTPGRAPVIGRHSRDADLKWPSAEVIREVYPTDGSVDVRVLGGADSAISQLDTTPRWAVYPFGAMTPSQFLEELDFWVYFHSESLHESFGMATAEAIAAGLVVILPAYMSATFGDGAVYCEPREVQATIDRFWKDASSYAEQSRRALAYAERRFGPKSLHQRIASFLDPR